MARPRSRRPARRPATRHTARTLLAVALLGLLVTAGSPGWTSYLIKRGDTLSAIAAKYHTTVAQLIKANRLPGNGNTIYAGETLRVPGSSSPHHRTGSRTAHHHVVRGDTLSGIAHKYGVSMSAISRANHLGRSHIVRLGATLTIPGVRSRTTQKSTSTNTFAGRTYSSAVVNAASRNRSSLAHRSVPSRTSMRTIIAGKARANGVDPALALAVSYQESGWNQRAVSVANAVGAMQVIPSTNAWISGVIGRRLDPLDAHDNATAGVVLLRVLTKSASSDRQAVAGYYQGLASVRANGMYPDTKRYVANVMSLRERFR